MTIKNKPQLLIAYNKFVDACLNQISIDELDMVVVDDIMGYGTARDEKIFSSKETKELISNQAKQGAGFQMEIETMPVFKKISAAGDYTVLVDEKTITLTGEQGVHSFVMRLTTVMELTDENWKAVHWHASIPQESTSEDTFHINEWKRKNEELQRLVDEKTAELSNRNKELKIEAALERVRLASMGMRKSEDLHEVIVVVFKQMESLGLVIHSAQIIDDFKNFTIPTCWIAAGGQVYPERIHLPFVKNAFMSRLLTAHKNGESFYSQQLTKQQKDEHFRHYFENSSHKNVPKSRQDLIFSYPGLGLSCVLGKNSALCVMRYDGVIYQDEENEIVQRFFKVFEQSYTRFLDLKKAEAQAREAQIEAALERVRAATMAMHNSEDLADVALVMFDQLKTLGGELFSFGIVLCNKHEGVVEQWHSLGDAGMITPFLVPIDLDYIHRYRYDQWKAGVEVFSIEIPSDYIVQHFDLMFELPSVQVVKQDLKAKGIDIGPPPWEIDYGASFRDGYLLVSSLKPFPEELIFPRFAQVFDQAYTRFLDLQKAEKRAREAEVEASLERVRTKAMAMNSSADLQKTLSLLISELEGLNIHPSRCGFGRIEGETKITELFVIRENKGEHKLVLAGKLKLEGHPLLDKMYVSWQENKEYLPVLKGKLMTSYYKKLKPYINIESPPPGTVQYGYFNFFKNGGLYTWSETPYTEETLNIYRKFTSTLGLSINRYQDLKDAEARAMENKRNSSLDRVRAEIASMRTTDDLERITPLIWKELTTLEVPFFRCGVFIINEEEQNCQVFLTNPEGASLAAMTIPIESVDLINSMTTSWKNKEVFKHLWNKEEFIEFTRSVMEQGYLDNAERYQGGEEPPESLALHFVPFAQGMLYVGNHDTLTSDHLDLVQSIANAFSVAYSRYEDFSKLEKANDNLEKSLENLKATQSLLIQAEKMASLGELTAGIAHEIQNPLNFVNNFSELCTDLLSEMKEELEKGDAKEAKEIISDITNNLKKIHFHGDRASSIVKGMLDHSRVGSGTKELADINVLCDEYLRLAYHGLRAKDKLFNAAYETLLDNDIPKIYVVPQEIGRVILNLINNAFYAVTRKNKENCDNYKPIVLVKTSQTKEEVIISVKDNGVGIPKEIINKIFQPFYTTKPTGQGTGLGLSLSYDIIQAHGGTMGVESEEGQGSEFIVKLPVLL